MLFRLSKCLINVTTVCHDQYCVYYVLYNAVCLTVGAQGKDDEALAMMSEVEAVEEKRKALRDGFEASLPPETIDAKRLRPCKVCGAFLSSHNNIRRLRDHYGSRLHVGFVKVFEKVNQLEVTLSLIVVVMNN